MCPERKLSTFSKWSTRIWPFLLELTLSSVLWVQAGKWAAWILTRWDVHGVAAEASPLVKISDTVAGVQHGRWVWGGRWLAFTFFTRFDCFFFFHLPGKRKKTSDMAERESNLVCLMYLLGHFVFYQTYILFNSSYICHDPGTVIDR